MIDLRAMSEQERLRLLVNSIQDYAIYMMDAEGRIATWNPGAERFKGYRAEEVLGKHYELFFSADDRLADLPRKALRVAAHEGRFETEGWRVRKDGSLFWAHVLIDPIHDDKGNHIGFAKITKDITEKKKAQDELENAKQALFQSQKLQALGELTGGIAHDFNNLMTVIAGSADFLRRNRNLPEAKKLSYLDGIIETAGRATKLTSQLLTFGRRQAIKPRVLNVAQRLTAAQQLLGRTLGSRFKLEIAVPDPDLKIEVDEAQFEAAIVNAVVNARDAMPNGGTITLSAATEQRDGNAFVRVSISDTGLGMPERVKERAFDPFFTTKEVGKGTGLGLSQIHGFAAQAGGIAEIDTKEGNGTTIALLIPQSSKPLDQPGVPADPLKTLPSLKILLVEDNDPVRAFTHDMLRDAGCNVIEASNASQALQLLDDSEQFDLMLADVVMPGQSGIELANQVRERRPNLPIVLVTGYSDELARGGVEYPCIAKPFTSTELRAAMESVLARP